MNRKGGLDYQDAREVFVCVCACLSDQYHLKIHVVHTHTHEYDNIHTISPFSDNTV